MDTNQNETGTPNTQKKLFGCWIREHKELIPVIIYGEAYDATCKEPERMRVTKRYADAHCTFTIPKSECHEIGYIWE